MNREEKNQQTRRRIMDSALAEFSKRGYGASSVNTICASKEISKGIIYHYFETKDDLYLACVGECFQRLTDHLRSALADGQGTAEEQLEQYFSARMAFFKEYPVYQPIFCEAVISPPEHLRAQLLACRQAFDDLTVDTLVRLLRPLPLRPPLTIGEVVDTFRKFQDFINAEYRVSLLSPEEFRERDEHCRKALSILLYGVVERSKDSYVPC